VSNPFDSRARRKFEAGNLFEWIVQLILMRAGIYKDSQEWIGGKIHEKALQVSGKLDHLVGGVPSYDSAMKEIEALNLPGLFTKATGNILDYFKEKFPEGIEEQGIEVKSTSSYGIEKVYDTKSALGGHDLQTFHYAYNKKIPFTLLYICRDDLRMAEISIMPDDKELFGKYKDKIVSVSNYYNKKEEPPKEAEILWKSKAEKFSKNFNVEYSGYLTRNYEYKNPAEYSDAIGPKVESWNRVIKRIKEGKDMTENNKGKIVEMSEAGFDIIELIKKNEV